MMKVFLVIFFHLLYHSLAENGEVSDAEIQDLKKRLAIVRQETLQETKRLTDVRKQEVRIMGEQAEKCVYTASNDLEEEIEAELERRIGPVERELDEGKPENREQLKKKIEEATVKAGVAVEERTLQFVKKANSCNERVTGVSFRAP